MLSKKLPQIKVTQKKEKNLKLENIIKLLQPIKELGGKEEGTGKKKGKEAQEKGDEGGGEQKTSKERSKMNDSMQKSQRSPKMSESKGLENK